MARPSHQHVAQPNMQQHSPPNVQARYLIPNTSGMVPAPAHLGFIPTSQSHVSAHPLPAHMPTFLQQGTAPFAVNTNHAYLNQTGMIGGLPTAATAASLASTRPNRQTAFPSYVYPSYD